ncbi:MAG: outer membrane beta-barrel protein [Steroidobacteraceae bacterium]
MRHARGLRWLLALWLAAHLDPASAQFKLQQTFMNTTAPGWTLSGNALLTAPSIDPAGQGWLRLTDTGGSEQGLALSSATVPANVAVTLRFNYVSWGGTGADGMTVFLYDSTQNMSGASVGGGLGYCGGAGGYFAIGLDEYGNFSNPGDRCGAPSGGPGREPESLVLRGPLSANNAYLTGTTVAGGIDDPGVSTRPSSKTVIVTLTPAAVGYTVTAEFQSASGQPFQILFSNVAVPYAPPASLSVGFSASTGGSTNNHELQDLVAATPDDLQVMMSGPATVLQGTPVTYTLTVTNNGGYAIDAANAPTVLDTVPAAITGASWTCVPSAGASCTASGSGNLNTSGLTLPVNGSVTYTITGTLAPSTACGGNVINSASADFGSSSGFEDPDETNNTASVTSTVSCAVTLVANPGTLSFGPQTVGVPSAAQTITVSGTNGALISNIAASGDFTESNDCNAALSGTSCTIEVRFDPASEGSLSGTLTITSSASSSPTTVMLGGTGTNAVPSPFRFTPLRNVAPSSSQVSNTMTVTGTNVPTTISVSSGAEYSINGGPYTSTPGIVSPGAQVTVRLTAPAAYNTPASAVLTVGGVDATFTVTTAAPPQLQNATVTSGGGGGLSPAVLMGLALLLLLRLRRLRPATVAVLCAVSAALGTHPAAAADWQAGPSNLYFGAGLGDVTSTLTAGDITNRLEADGYDVLASDVERSSLSGSLYVGYDLPGHFALEFGWTYLGHTRTALQGIEPPDLQQLLYDASRPTLGNGNAWPLVGRYEWTLRPRLSLDLRAGPYRWVTHSDLWLGSVEQLDRNDRGWGYTLGLGPRYALSEHWALALNLNYFASTSDNRLVQLIAGIDYHL